MATQRQDPTPCGRTEGQRADAELPVLLRLPNLRRAESPVARLHTASELAPPAESEPAAATEPVSFEAPAAETAVQAMPEGPDYATDAEAEPVAVRLPAAEPPRRPPFDPARDAVVVRNQNALQYVVACGVIVAVIAAALVTRDTDLEPSAKVPKPASRKTAPPSWQLPTSPTPPARIATPAPGEGNLSLAPAAVLGEPIAIDAAADLNLNADAAPPAATANAPARISALPGGAPYPHTQPAPPRSDSPPSAYFSGPRAAEFEGTITAPAYRAEHDRDRSSIY